MFQKSAIALATVLAVTAAHAAEFKLNDNTKFEVNVDVGAYQLSEKDSSGKNEKSFVGKGLNQVEIKASHNVESGIKVFGEIEIDYDPIGDNGDLATDDTKFGIDSKAFGKITAGQFDSYFEDNLAEALASGHGENGFVSEPASGNDGRHIQYTKSFGDFTFAYDLTLDASNADATKSATGSAVTLVYKMGDLKVVVGSDSIAKYKNDGDDASAKSTTGVAATYELTDGLSLTALSAKAKKVDNSSTQYTGFKVAYEMGAFDFTLASQRVKPNGGTSSTEMAYGVAYEAFKDMSIYMDVAKFDKTSGEGDVIEIGVAYSF